MKHRMSNRPSSSVCTLNFFKLHERKTYCSRWLFFMGLIPKEISRFSFQSKRKAGKMSNITRADHNSRM